MIKGLAIKFRHAVAHTGGLGETPKLNMKNYEQYDLITGGAKRGIGFTYDSPKQKPRGAW